MTVAASPYSGLTLAISLWHIHFQPLRHHVIMMPVIFSLAFSACWLGIMQKHRASARRLCRQRPVIGLSVWTHPTGRLRPCAHPLHALAPVADRMHALPVAPTAGWPLGVLFLTGVLAFIVFLPLGIEFYRHPEFFVGHASEVSVFAERVSGDSPLAALAANVLHVLGMFSVAGDWEWTHNLAGRPVFDLLMAAAYFWGSASGPYAKPSRAHDRVETDPAKSDAREPDAGALPAPDMGAGHAVALRVERGRHYSRTLPSLPPCS